jgi:hypothetical protein
MNENEDCGDTDCPERLKMPLSDGSRVFEKIGT